MVIKQDPVTGLWAREDGAVLMPPSGTKFKKFRWTFGSKRYDDYRQIVYKGKHHLVHRIICCAFHGLPPEGKPEVDHISRIKSANFALNLHWADSRGNNTNRGYVDRSVEKFGVRECEDKKAYESAYMKPYNAAKRAKMNDRGLTQRKGPDGRWGWFPRIRKREAV